MPKNHGHIFTLSWRRNLMETFYALLVLCVGKPPVISGFPSKRPVTWRFDVFFNIRLMAAWSNYRDAGDLKRHVAHSDVTVMMCMQFYTWANYFINQLNAKEPYPMNVPKLIVTMCVLLCGACLHYCGDFSIFVRLYNDSPNSIYILYTQGNDNWFQLLNKMTTSLVFPCKSRLIYYHWSTKLVIMPSLVAPGFVVRTIHDATSDGNGGIMRIVDFQCTGYLQYSMI